MLTASIQSLLAALRPSAALERGRTEAFFLSLRTLPALLLFTLVLTASAVLAPVQPTLAAAKAEIDALTSQFPSDWPAAPEITSEAAILVEVNSGTILYAKNATQSMYPASTTKLMTAYLTLQNASLDDIVTYSSTAVLSLEPGSSHIGLKVGESLTVRDSLYGLLLPSANEVANGLAELVGGSISGFVTMMNQTAQQLGCVNTHFANANGLHDATHSTCPYDLYLIMRACIQSSTFIEIASDNAYVRPADELLNKEIPMGATNQLIRPDSEYYTESVVCGKTGWTEQAGRCLVTYASQDGLDLICVVMKTEVPNQYLDTIALLNYGFDSFTAAKASDVENPFSLDSLILNSPLQLPQQPEALLALDTSSYLALPNNLSSDRIRTSVESSSENGTATVTYWIDSYPIGHATIVQQANSNASDLWNSDDSADSLLASIPIQNQRHVSIWLVLTLITVLLLILILLLLLIFYRKPPKQRLLRGGVRLDRKGARITYEDEDEDDYHHMDFQ